MRAANSRPYDSEMQQCLCKGGPIRGTLQKAIACLLIGGSAQKGDRFYVY